MALQSEPRAESTFYLVDNDPFKVAAGEKREGRAREEGTISRNASFRLLV